MEQSEMEKKNGSQRRKILGWLGVGAVGAMIIEMLPMKRIVSKNLMKKKSEKVAIAINKDAVKRSRKVTRNV
jgi:hypothetical protein